MFGTLGSNYANEFGYLRLINQAHDSPLHGEFGKNENKQQTRPHSGMLVRDSNVGDFGGRCSYHCAVPATLITGE